jgi:hypothetical protein
MRAHICSTQTTGAYSWAIDHHSNPRRNTMIVEAQVTINGSKAAIWDAITKKTACISGLDPLEE